MWAKLLAAVLLVEAVLAQEGSNDQVRKLRFRRPRPKVVDIDNPEGELSGGSPVPIVATETSFSFEDNPVDTPLVLSPAQVQLPRPQQSTSGSSALDALIATAQRDEPKQLEIQEIPTASPLLLEPAAESPRRPVNGRRGDRPRPRPRQQERPVSNDGEEPEVRGRPRGGEREEPVATLERYNHKNEDGSFTFGYVAADGSFREETRGADCITRGKYGYIDPTGVKREYTYTSGLSCEIGEDGEDSLQTLDNGEINGIDTIDPAERFRQTQSVQLAENEIPEAAKRQRTRTNIQRGQVQPQQEAGVPVPVPQRRPEPIRTVNGGNPLNNLINIAEAGATPVAQPAFTRRPTVPQRRPAAPANPGSFDFDAELEGFTLNRPSLTFEQNRAQNGGVGAQFQSQLVFDQQAGTFKTELQQNIAGGQQLSLSNNAAPFVATTAVPSTALPTAQPTTFFSTQGSPAPTTAAVGRNVLPAGTIKLDFEPLNIPQSFPTTLATPAPTSAVRLPSPTPTLPSTSQASSPAPSSPNPTNTFFVFQPFNQGTPAPSPRPISNPFPSSLNPAAFQVRPAPAGQPSPASQSASAPGSIPLLSPIRPSSLNSQPAPTPLAPRPQSAPTPLAPRPQAVPAPFAPRPQSAPAPLAPRPQASSAPQVAPAPQQFSPSAPQIQFGFQPVQQQQQQQNRPAPFTAFSSGIPPQQLRQQQQLGVPPQLQQQARPQQLGVPPQLQQGGTRFAPQPQFQPQQQQAGQPQLRPAQFTPGQSAQPFNPFSVFTGA